MKDFNFKEKEVVKDEDLLKYKNFNQVIQKHDTISKGYSTIRKIWGGIGLATILSVVAFYNFKNETIPSNPIHLTENKTTEIVQPLGIKSINKSTIQLEEIKVHPQVTAEEKTITESEKEVVPKEDITENKSEETTTIDTILRAKNTKETIEDYYHLEQKTAEERIKLPTLFVAGKAWPSVIRKRDLIKQSSLTAAYLELNKEVPIISYSMMRVDPTNYKKENKKILNRDGRYSAAILREAHRSKSGEFIIYKDIIVFVPGIGRVNMGDLKVEVADDKTYNKRLRERKPITL
jgi:hypothetical protein